MMERNYYNVKFYLIVPPNLILGIMIKRNDISAEHRDKISHILSLKISKGYNNVPT